MNWEVILSKQAVKDLKNIKQAGLGEKTKSLLKKIQQDPLIIPPRYESLVGNLKGFYSRRINIQHRLVYSVDIDEKVIHVLRCWTHYE
ncbi:MAG: Txe/YoeB family addiction module toxin [Mariprofundaceae bacterium]